MSKTQSSTLLHKIVTYNVTDYPLSEFCKWNAEALIRGKVKFYLDNYVNKQIVATGSSTIKGGSMKIHHLHSQKAIVWATMCGADLDWRGQDIFQKKKSICCFN